VTFFQRIKTPFTESAADDEARLQPRQRQVGDVLQERREDLGLDLDEIGAMLRIKPAYLAALEQGRSDDLPGPAYAIGFVRAYADFLGLNTEQILVRFKDETAGVTARPDLALPVPLAERSLPGRALVLVALIVALCGYGIWYYLSTEDRNRPERVAAVPAELRIPTAPVLVSPSSIQPAAQAATAPTPPPSPAPTVAQPNLAVAAPNPNPGASAKPAPPAPVTPQQQAAAVQPKPAPPVAAAPAPATVTTPQQLTVAPAQPKPAPPPAATSPPTPAPQQLAAVTPPPPSPAPTAASKVSIRALADCWIQIRAPDQSIVFSRILKSGEIYNVPVRAGLWLRTGNAGVLEIAVDGRPAPSIGGIGTLRRDVALDPAELAAGTAVHG
jgi:cytoskeleton protein RodZ